MYRNITYNVNKDKGWIGEITLTTWDDKGEPMDYTIEHQSYLYYQDTKGKAKSWFGDDIKIKRFKSVIDRHKWLKENTLVNVFECLSPVNEFLINTFTGTNENIDKFMQHPLHTAIVDIEIAIEDIFPEPSEARFPVNLITLYDNFTKSYTIWSLSDFKWEEDGDKVERKIFNSESALLRDFILTFIDGKYDILSGWNSFQFDMPYIINRASQLIDADIVNRLSSTNVIKPKTFMFRTDGRYYSGYALSGLSQIDYMLIYKKYTKMLGAEKQSYKLENVCQDELGYGKTDYKGNFKQLYQNDFDLFVKYNKQDVKLLVDLEEKLQYLKLTRMLCNYSLLEYEGIYYTLGIVVNNLVQFGRKVGTHIPYRRKDKEVEHKKFTGAFVFPTHVGKYDKGIASFDVQSLYPNTMISLNISPEKKVGKIVQGYGDRKIIKLKNGVTKELSEEQYNNLFENKPYSLASNGVIFETKTQGILPAFLESFFNKRLEIKKELKDLQHLSKSKPTKKNKAYMSELHARQQVIKIILTSV